MKKEDFKEKIAEVFISALKEEKLPWIKKWSVEREAFKSFNYVSKRSYRGSNRFFLELVTQAEGFKTNAFLTFTQVKALGWELKDAKGKGIPVSFWYPFNTVTKKSLSWEEYNNILLSEDEEKKVFLPHIVLCEKIYYVFNAKYVVINEEGKTLEEDILSKMPKRVRKEEDILLANTVLDNYCDAEGIRIIYGGDKACYRPSLDDILLPERKNFSADSFFVSTKAHECSHSTGHSSRLNRDLKGSYETESYAVEELRAEISAAFLCADFGLPQVGKVVENSKAYIQSWIEGLQDKPDALLKALDEAEKISSYIKEKGNYAELFEKEEIKKAS